MDPDSKRLAEVRLMQHPEWRLKLSIYLGMRRQLRRLCVLRSAVTVEGAAWSAVRRWTTARRNRYASLITSLRKRIAVFRRTMGPAFYEWRPRPLRQAERIARQYKAEYTSRMLAEV